jgi:WD40 repeat protein
MVKSVLSISAIVAFLILDCNPSNLKNEPYTGYNLTSPDAILILPDILHEISGITIIDSITVACIQDENGIVFIYNIKKNKIKNQLNFHIKGDYEDIVRVGKALYILRSDGAIFEISDFESENCRLDLFETDIPARDNEGLCYDMDNNRLLIACKSKKSIYSFDLATKTLSEKPAFTFDINSLIKFALKNNIKLKTRKNKKDPIPEPVLKFRTSAICIHPVTKKLFLISSEDHLLFIFDINGKIEHIEKLNHKMFIQPEGLTFKDNGDMLISNEGKDKSPTILRFDYNK